MQHGSAACVPVCLLCAFLHIVCLVIVWLVKVWPIGSWRVEPRFKPAASAPPIEQEIYARPWEPIDLHVDDVTVVGLAGKDCWAKCHDSCWFLHGETPWHCLSIGLEPWFKPAASALHRHKLLNTTENILRPPLWAHGSWCGWCCWCSARNTYLVLVFGEMIW